ncbi:DUF6436 domain-containing protein [Rheinheimera sp. UJ51]|uniref:DUF6436 domain-containing protein n=1 Tax=unclassified Rheinheimera TaxID=115860 RepID=UPI001E55F01E|nr:MULTISPECIES: DUF6436 domain-containing protein [unclassified Rheinheimera]MCC5451233.1 DUF6436 domain-containing protein [Rheinheimera sp. UJ51]MCF4009980.1 DUF6436 domain-containing protein [Rheinheimera sp. UJ63]
MQMQHRVRLVALLFISWIAIASIGLYLFGQQYYGLFDQTGVWQRQTSAAFAIERLGIAPANDKQVVHVTQTGCVCNRLAAEHRDLFTHSYQITANRQFQFSAEQLQAAGFSLPAAPAVLIFEQGQLIYAGPYATGPLCSVDDSLIAPILRNTLQLPGLWLNGEVKACRCLVTPSMK